MKATRKITKAMQMVAAAKLRRAQEAATAARPYAERMDAVLANLAGASPARPARSPLLVGTGKDEAHLLIVMTAERGLCGGFNSNIAALARDDASAWLREGKTVKILCVGRKGRDRCGATTAGRSSTASISKASSSSASPTRPTSRDKVLALFEAGEFDVATLYFSEFKSVISQKPTALQLIPASCPSDRRQWRGRAAAPSTSTSPTRTEILTDLLPRNIADADLPRPAGERRLRAGRAHERHGQRHAQRRRHDRQADACATTAAARPRSPRS